MVAGDLWGADLDLGVLDEVVRGHPLWLLVGRDHFVDGFLHDGPTAGSITLQNEDCFFLPQQNLSRQQAWNPCADDNNVVNGLIVVFEEGGFFHLSAFIEFAPALTSFAGSPFIFDKDLFHGLK